MTRRGDFGYRSAQRGSTRPSRVRLTDHQKCLRRYARSEGRETIAALNRALNPVYDGDEESWANIAVFHARAAWRLALAAFEKPGGS